MINISNIDLRLLRIFMTVAECEGFSAAQAQLGISQSTVSNHMLALEERLRCRLCERGRTGFQLTHEGKVVYDAAVRLFSSIEDFRDETESLCGVFTGDLRIGLVDNTVTDPQTPIVKAIERFYRRPNNVHIRLTIDSPISLEKKLIDRQIDMAIVGYVQHLPNLKYQTLYTENSSLFCGQNHPLYKMRDEDLRIEDIQKHSYASRGYWHNEDSHRIGVSGAATVDQMEALAILILSGVFIGYLPTHFAERWVIEGHLRPLLDDELTYISRIALVTRKGVRMTRLSKAFIKDLQDAVGEHQRASNVGIRGRVPDSLKLKHVAKATVVG